MKIEHLNSNKDDILKIISDQYKDMTNLKEKIFNIKKKHRNAPGGFKAHKK